MSNNQPNQNLNLKNNNFINLEPDHQAKLNQIKQKIANQKIAPNSIPNQIPDRATNSANNSQLQYNHQNSSDNSYSQKSNQSTKKSKKSNILGKIVLGITGLLVLASVGIIINNNFLQPFGRIPNQSIISGNIELISDLGLFKNPEGKTYCDNDGKIKPTSCEDPAQYSYYKAGKFQSGELSGYDRIITITKNYPSEPIVFATKGYSKFIINGLQKLNEQKDKLSLPQSKFNATKIDKFYPIQDAMVPVIDINSLFSLTGFQSIDKFGSQKISVIQKKIGTEKRKLDSGTEVDITKFEYSLPLSSDANLNKLSTIKGSNSIVYKSKLDTPGLYGAMNNSVIVTDSTGLGYQYYIQFKDKLDVLLKNADVYLNQSKDVLEYIKVLNDKLIAEGRDPKLPESQELAKQELRAKFPAYRSINSSCPVQFGVYNGEIQKNSEIKLYNSYGSGTIPNSQSNPNKIVCYGEYSRYNIKENWNENDFESIGVTNNGIKLYIPKTGTKQAEIITEHYKSQINLSKDVQNNSDKTVFENFNPQIPVPDESMYMSKNPIIATQDPFGRTIFLGEVDYYGVN